jgi:hypothetical protein
MNSIANAKRASICLAFVTILVTMTGCSFMNNLLMTKRQRQKRNKARLKAQIDQYVAEKNTAKLKQFCEDKKVSYFMRKKTCGKLVLIQTEQLEASSCSQITERFTEIKKYSQRRAVWDSTRRLYYKGGVKIAKCGQWDFVFRSLLHWGNRNRMGVTLLNKINEAGMNAEQQLISWMKKQTRPFDFKNGGYAAYNAVQYFKKKEKFSHCRLFHTLTQRATEKIKGKLIYYFYLARCKNAERMMTARLSSDVPGHRRQACDVLGRIGTPRVLRKLRILSYSDPAFTIKRRKYVAYRVYHVRTACRAAMGKIQLRAQ